MLNKVLLIGRITSSPELKYTENNKAYTKICVAINRYTEGTDFINVKVWNKQAENVCNYLDKGSLILVEGTMMVRQYEDKDGNKRTSTEIIAQNVKFLDKKSSKENAVTETDVEENNIDLEEINIDDDFLD